MSLFQFSKRLKHKDLKKSEALWKSVSHWPFVEALKSEQINQIEERLKKSDFLKNETLIICGVGGSTGGVKVIYDLVPRIKKIIFFDDIDSLAFKKSLSQVSSFDSLSWLFVSKSGDSEDVLALINHLFPYFSKIKNWKESTVVITANKEGALYRWSKSYELDIFWLPQDTCGRFSIFSLLSLIPARFLDVDLRSFLDGAKSQIVQNDQTINEAQQLIESFQRKELVHQCWVYSQRLKSLAYWFQQLWCESLFKKQTRSGGPAPDVGFFQVCHGSKDQHSLLQPLFSQRLESYFIWVLNSPVCFLEGPILKNSQFPRQKILEGQGMGDFLKILSQSFTLSLKEKGISYLQLEPDFNDEKILGSTLMHLQVLVALMAEILDIDAFNQPEVDSAKGLIRSSLTRLN